MINDWLSREPPLWGRKGVFMRGKYLRGSYPLEDMEMSLSLLVEDIYISAGLTPF